MNELLRLVNVNKEFLSGESKLSILNNICLIVEAGETIAITGPSGSGKSTLLGLMAGLEKLTSGEIYFCGDKMGAWSEDKLSQWRSRKVGFIFQNFRLIKTLTALENVSLPLEILGQNVPNSQRKAMELLSELGMEKRAQHFPQQLSGGEQQRVAIARAYAHEPEIIFADEPTGSLDSTTAEAVLGSLLKIAHQRKTCLLVVTHDPKVAQLLQRNVKLAAGALA